MKAFLLAAPIAVFSLLGVAGGELIIPALILVFGLGIKEAGTASLLISSVTIFVGLFRYWKQGRYHEKPFWLYPDPVLAKNLFGRKRAVSEKHATVRSRYIPSLTIL